MPAPTHGHSQDIEYLERDASEVLTCMKLYAHRHSLAHAITTHMHMPRNHSHMHTLAKWGEGRGRRKEKRKGWTQQNFFHICITSYKLVVQDQHVFK